jgi:predicted permease
VFTRLLFWLKAVFQRDRLETRMDGEMRLHVELHTENLVRSGVAPDEARRRALAAFGGIEAAKDHCRDARGANLIQDVLKDLRYAVRMLAKSPAFALTAVFSLALGIGANTALFSLVDAVLLRMLPVREPQQLLEITNKGGGTLSYAMYEALRERDTVFSGVFALSAGRLGAGVRFAGVETGDVHFSPVSGTYFDVLGVTAVMGHAFTRQDNSSDAAVISYGFWQRPCGSDPQVIGKVLRFGDRAYTVTGIAPPGFTGIATGQPVDVWIPITWVPRQALQNPDAFILRIVARLKPGVTEKQARADVELVARELSIEWKYERPLQVEVVPASGGLTQLRRRFSRPLLALTAIVGLLLLITVANIANMLLARAQARQREVGIRLSLGASRGRLIRQLLTESAVLAFAGAALGVILAPHIVAFLIRFISSATGDLELPFGLDLHMLAFTGLMLIASVFLFGLAPALAATRFNLSPMFNGAGAGTTSGQRPMAGLKALMVAQVAISCVLLVGTVLFARSLLMLTHVDLGFRQENVLLLHAEFEGPSQQQSQPFAQILDRLIQVPGVISTALSSESLFSGNTWTEAVTAPGFSRGRGKDRVSVLLLVSPGFFRTLATPILQGRDFDPRDSGSSPRIAIVNEAMARYYFGLTDVVGRTFRIEHSDFPQELTIVGVVRNTKYKTIREETSRIVYLPYLQFPKTVGEAYIAVRTTQNPMDMDDLLRREAKAGNPRIQFRGVTTQAQLVNGTIAQDRMLAELSGFFGFAAAALVCLGLYGITTYEAGRRTAEIGVRIALGARSGDVMRLVMGRSLILVAGGIAIGLGMAFLLTRPIESLLFVVRPADTVTVVAVVATLFVIAALAAYWPAHRASTLDPAKLLKSE